MEPKKQVFVVRYALVLVKIPYQENGWVKKGSENFLLKIDQDLEYCPPSTTGYQAGRRAGFSQTCQDLALRFNVSIETISSHL